MRRSSEEAGIDLETIRRPADLVPMLRARPEAATPALVRKLKERVEALYRADAQAAHDLAECVFLLAERCADAESLALGHRAMGIAAHAVGSNREALGHYEAAERLYRVQGDEIERARALRSMIDALMHLGRYDEALAAGEEAREIFRRHGQPILAAQVETNVGNVFYRLDRNAEALEAFNRALRTFREAGDEAAVSMVEFNRANIFSNLNELGEAERGYRRALRYYRAKGFRVWEGQCLYKLAYLAYLRFRFSEALGLFERVRELELELGDLQWAALCTLSQAELLLSLNAWEEASGLACEAEQALKQLGLDYESAKAILFRGLATVHLREFPRAGALLEEAGRRFARAGNEVHRALTELYRAELALLCGDPAQALPLSRGAARLFAGEGLRAKEAYARIVAARALVQLGRPASARRQCSIALAGIRRFPAASIAYQAHHLLGRLEPDRARARHHFDEALAFVELLRAHVVPDELRASFHRDKIALYEDYARLLLAVEGDDGIEAAFEVVEAAKSRRLSDMQLGVPPDTEIVAGLPAADGDWRTQLEELNGCYRLLNEAELSGRPKSAGEALRREIERREAQLARRFRSIQLGGAKVAASTQPDAKLLPCVRAALEDDEALIEFFFLDEELQAFVVRPDGAAYVPVGARIKEIREALDRLRFQLEKSHLGRDHVEAHRASLRAATLYYLDRLAELLWEPLTGSLSGVRKLVLVPAGPLFYVPFHALREAGLFLIERFEICQTASARMYLAARRGRQGDRNPALVLGVTKAELPSIEAEIAAVCRHLASPRILVGAQASRTALRRLGSEASIIHIASHALFRGDNPLLSAIELADGRLTFYDLFDLKLSSDLVVLSGCQTGRQGVLEGDELMGLARGFLQAGAGSLLASLWPVDDSATARFMERFYARLADGETPRSALRRTMCELLEEGVDPRDWAPFYLTGRANGREAVYTVHRMTQEEAA